jgi:hypothetical protein
VCCDTPLTRAEPAVCVATRQPRCVLQATEICDFDQNDTSIAAQAE